MPRIPPTTSTPPPLGDLEVAVLEHVWNNESASAKEAHAVLGVPRGIALNTVQSAMERLFRKGLLSRSKSGHAFQYSARVARQELVAGLINEVLGRFGADSSAALAAFVEVARGLDEDALSAFESELAKRHQPGEET